MIDAYKKSISDSANERMSSLGRTAESGAAPTEQGIRGLNAAKSARGAISRPASSTRPNSMSRAKQNELLDSRAARSGAAAAQMSTARAGRNNLRRAIR